MNVKENLEIKEIIDDLKIGMIDFIEEGVTEYSEKDVDLCIKLIDDFLGEISNSSSKDAGMKLVEKLVINLNELNDKCECELIETGQREQIAEIIILAGFLKGYNEKDEDITEEWREW